ncbi:hypothetical protein FPRO04_06132 [Fusarium proliferatum]|nr:hypothetical protein FPRO04_06132 [Fusarium proliferatum]
MDFRDHALPITPLVTPVIDGDVPVTPLTETDSLEDEDDNAPVTPLIETYWLEDEDGDVPVTPLTETDSLEDEDDDAPVTPLIENYWLEYEDDELPMSRKDVDKLCGTHPSTVELKYFTLQLKLFQGSGSLAETIKVMEAQKSWEYTIKDRFVANQYRIVESQKVETGFYWRFVRGLESFAKFVPDCDPGLQAFQVRSELETAAPTSRLSLNMLVFSPVPECERAAALPFEE